MKDLNAADWLLVLVALGAALSLLVRAMRN